MTDDELIGRQPCPITATRQGTVTRVQLRSGAHEYLTEYETWELSRDLRRALLDRGP